MELGVDSKNLLQLLVGLLKQVEPGNVDTYIGYKKCHDILGIRLMGGTWGRSLQAQGLTELADWTKDKKLPGITGLIIDTTKGEPKPSAGYFSLFGKESSDLRWWHSQIRKAKKYDWDPLINEEFFTVPSDFYGSPKRKDIVTSRVIRDTALSNEVKRLNYFQCQLCELSIELPNGALYVEAHHIKPLGKPHNGPDETENLICVCPNHHAMLDYGAIKLNLDNLKVHGHQIAQKYVDYHNEEIA